MRRKPEPIRHYYVIQAGGMWRVISLVLMTGYVAGVTLYLVNWPLDSLLAIFGGVPGVLLLLALLYAWTWQIDIGPHGVCTSFLGLHRFTPAERIAGFRYTVHDDAESGKTRVYEIIATNGKSVATFTDAIADFDRCAEIIRRHYRNVDAILDSFTK